MKIINKKHFIFIFLALTLSLCTFFGINKNEKTYADESSEFFTLTQYESLEKYTNGESGSNIANDGIAYISTTNAIVGIMKGTTDKTISAITPSLVYNGQNYSEDELEKTYSISIEMTDFNSVFEMVLTFNDKTLTAPFGKYSLKLDYIVTNSDGSSSYQTLTYNFYVLRSSDYYNGTSVNTAFSGCVSVTSNSVYDRNFHFNYQPSETIAQTDRTNTLPTLKLNYKNIGVTITKTFQKSSSVQKIWFDGKDIQTDNSLVYFYKCEDANFIDIVFNDLGTYEIEYNFIYTYGETVENLAVSTLTNSKHRDLLEIFGYQLYYSDVETSKLKEFKNIDSKGKIQSEITDYSYLVETFNKSLEQDKRRDALLDKLNNGEITIQQTNQAPVQFAYNVEIYNSSNATLDNAISGYWKITYNQDKSTYQYSLVKYEYDNSPISEEGIYLVNLVYKYTPTVTGSDELCESTKLDGSAKSEKLRSQWFLFEITKSTTDFSIKTQSDKTLNSGSYSNEDVTIKKDEQTASMFNANTKLVVSFYSNYSSVKTSETVIPSETEKTFTENGNYTVTMYFGKGLTRSYSSSFTIDKNPIENIQIFGMNKDNNTSLYYRDNEIEFLTNKDILVSWNQKASGSTVSAKYKFIPLTLRDNYNVFDASLYKSYFSSNNDYSILSQYEFNISSTEYTAVDYTSYDANANVPSNYILSQSGLYLFKVSDTAGNEKIFAFVIDKTSGQILQQIDGEFVEPTKLNTQSCDVNIVFGNNKVIKFNNMASTTTGDSWLNEILANEELFSKYFSVLEVNTRQGIYLTSKINSKVLQLKNNTRTYIDNNESTNYSVYLPFSDGLDYIFYTQDSSSNSSTVSEDDYSAIFSVRLSSDASQTMMVFNNKSQYLTILDQVEDTSASESKKDQYFFPTTKKTLENSNETLTLQFIATPEEGVLEVDEMTYTYTPFSKTRKVGSNNSYAYTYCFDSSKSVSGTIYSKTNPSQTLATLSGDYYTWAVNTEYVYAKGEQTQAGKYTITRIYANFGTTKDRLLEKQDYFTRTFTFIIDRNGIITTPEMIEGIDTMHSYVGDAIKLIVGENNPVTFNDVYLAENTTYQNIPILETNKLPVLLYIPKYTYGYDFSNSKEGTFNYEESLTYYTKDIEITPYTLSATVKYAFNLFELEQSKEIYTSLSTSSFSNNYLEFDISSDSLTKKAFKKVGYYKVTITQNSLATYGKNEFSFIFSVKATKPSFEIVDEDGTEFNKDENQNYYTNNDKITLKWEDSTNEYLAKINKDEIYYSINNASLVKIDKTLIKTDQNVNTISIDLKNINAYHNGDKIIFFMQYEGKSTDYQENFFKTNATLIIDTTAPEKNINNLVNLCGIDASLIRSKQEKYNSSVSTGLYRYYAFAIDVSKLEDILDFNTYTTGETYEMYYRIFETQKDGKTISTKYNNIYEQETQVDKVKNSLQNFTEISMYNNTLKNSNCLNKYIEIVEIDIAGNITIYTIYLTDFSLLSNENSIVYRQNDKENDQKITHIQLSSNISINAKSAFNLEKVNFANYSWSQITVNGTTYLKTPYSNDVYYNLSTYTTVDTSASETTLNALSKLTTSNQKQNITLSLVPLYGSINLSVSVLNTSLSVLHTRETTEYATQEGILIKIPSSTSSQDATIYATLVQIYKYTKDEETSKYEQTKIYSEDKEGFFATLGQQLVSTTNVTLSYINYLGNNYMKIIVSSPVANNFYKYEITDNFSETQNFTNIFNSDIVEKELTSEVDFVEVYENGVKYYYTTKDAVFTYNSAKDHIIITVSTQNGSILESQSFDLSKDLDISRFNSSDFGSITAIKNSNLVSVKLCGLGVDMANSVIGGERKFVIKKYFVIEDSASASSDDINVVIYNKIPEFTLLDTQNQNINDLFNKDTMYGSEIKITFKQTAKIVCEVYLLDSAGKIERISSGKTISTPQKYTLVIKFTDIFTDEMYDVELEFTISNNDSEFYKVVYRLDGVSYYAQRVDGEGFTYQDGQTTRTILEHYIINTKDYEIIFNTEQGFYEYKTSEKVIVSGFETYIHYLRSSGERPNTCTVAISIIPQTSNILKNFTYYDNDSSSSLFPEKSKASTFIVSKDESSMATKRISWQSYYGIPSNKVTVSITYGNSQIAYTPNLVTKDNVTSLTLSTSGVYYLVFSDLAGNVHVFANSTSTYEIKYLRSVIYLINDESPINNAIYNDNVVVKIPTYTKSYYDAQPKLYALKNGEEYSPERDSSKGTYTFTETGLYQVWFSATVTENNKKMELNEQPIYFLIIKERESRQSFSFSEYENYYVKSIKRNDVDITKSITNQNMGNIVYKEQLVDGKKVQNAYLKNFTLLVNDAQSGKGLYTITIATDNEFGQEFTFSFWLNNQTPNIQISAKENEETTDTIKVSFNTQDLIEDVGDCILRITGLDDIYLNSKNLSDGKIKSIYNIELTDSRTYFIQLYNDSGKLLYSYKVIKNEPLNAVSIIVIVVSCVVVIGLTLTFILLRKKMKIR